MANPYLETMDDDDEVIEIPMKSATKSNPYLDDMEDTPAKPQFQTQPPEDTFVSRVLPDFMLKNKREVVTMDGPKGQEQIMDLPVPSKEMYKDLSSEDRNALYEAYMNHPKTQKGTEFSGGTYKGQPIPLPLEDNSSGVFGGVYEGARSTAELGSAVAEKTGMLPEGTTGKLNEVLPAYEPEKLRQKAGSLVGQVMTAGGVEGALFKTGAKALGGGAKALSIATKLPKVSKATQAIAKTAGHIIATSAAGAITFGNPTEETKEGFETKNSNWFAGNENALASNLPGKVGKFFSGLDGKSESEAASIIEDRLNIALDAATVALPVEMLAAGGKKLGLLAYNMFAENFHGAVSKNVNRKVAFRDFMDQVYDVATANTPEEREFLNKKLIGYLEDPKNSQIILDTGVEGVEKSKVDLSTLQTLRNALAGDDSEMAKRILQKFEDQQSNIINKGIGDRTRAAAERPAEALKKVTAQTEAAFNPAGQNTPEITAGAIQREGQERVGSAIADSEVAIGTSEKLNKEIPYEIATKVKEGNASITGIKDQKFKSIPNDQSRIGSSYLKNINSILGRHGDVLPKELMTSILESEDDYGRIIKDVRPKLVKEINRLEAISKSSTAQRPAQLDDLIKLKNRIVKIEQEHMEAIGRYNPDDPNLASNPGVQKSIRGKQEVAQKHKEAEEYYTDVYSKTVGQGIPKKIKKIGDKPATKFDEPSKLDAEAEAVRAGLKKPETGKHLEETLSKPEYGNSGGLITKMTDAEKAAENAKFARIQAEEDTYGKLMDDFFSREGAIKGKEGDTGTSFRDLFTGKFNKDKIKRLSDIVESKGDEKVKAGWRASYMKVFMDKVIPDAGVQVKEAPDLIEVGKLVFKDQPEVMSALEQLIDPAVLNARDARARPKGSSIGDALAGAKRDVSSFAKTVYGPLSRPGTILNTWMGRLLDVADPKSVRAHFRDSIMADPKVFVKAIKDYQAAKEPSRRMRIAFNYLVRAGVVNEKDWDDYSSSQLNE